MTRQDDRGPRSDDRDRASGRSTLPSVSTRRRRRRSRSGPSAPWRGRPGRRRPPRIRRAEGLPAGQERRQRSGCADDEHVEQPVVGRTPRTLRPGRRCDRSWRPGPGRPRSCVRTPSRVIVVRDVADVAGLAERVGEIGELAPAALLLAVRALHDVGVEPDAAGDRERSSLAADRSRPTSMRRGAPVSADLDRLGRGRAGCRGCRPAGCPCPVGTIASGDRARRRGRSPPAGPSRRRRRRPPGRSRP